MKDEKIATRQSYGTGEAATEALQSDTERT